MASFYSTDPQVAITCQGKQQCSSKRHGRRTFLARNIFSRQCWFQSYQKKHQIYNSFIGREVDEFYIHLIFVCQGYSQILISLAQTGSKSRPVQRQLSMSHFMINTVAKKIRIWEVCAEPLTVTAQSKTKF